MVSTLQPINKASGIESVAIYLENKFFPIPLEEGSEAVSIHMGWAPVHIYSPAPGLYSLSNPLS